MARKPVSVWIGQILIAVVGLLFAAIFVYSSVVAWPIIMRAAARNQTILVIAGLEALLKLALIAFVVWTVVLISKRSPLGRWFGLLCLAMLLAGAIYGHFLPPSRWQFPLDNDAQRFGALIGEATAFAAYVLLMVRFGFSRASKLFFTGSKVVA